MRVLTTSWLQRRRLLSPSSRRSGYSQPGRRSARSATTTATRCAFGLIRKAMRRFRAGHDGLGVSLKGHLYPTAARRSRRLRWVGLPRVSICELNNREKGGARETGCADPLHCGGPSRDEGTGPRPVRTGSRRTDAWSNPVHPCGRSTVTSMARGTHLMATKSQITRLTARIAELVQRWRSFGCPASQRLDSRSHKPLELLTTKNCLTSR
jgi:hypothetical protein